MRTLAPTAARLRVMTALKELETSWPKHEALVEQFKADVLALARRLNPKRKVNDLAKAFALVRGSTEEFEILGTAHSAALGVLGQRREELNALIDELSLTAAILSETGSWFSAFVVRSGDYATQGFGATRYAAGTAQLHAFGCKPLGVDAVIWRESRRIDYGGQPSCFHGEYSATTFVVAVRVDDPVDVEIMKRRPSLTMREQVKWCWANGVNPRVYYPMLPHGYEERVGIDYQGRDVTR